MESTNDKHDVIDDDRAEDMLDAGDRRDLQERIKDLTQQLEERKSAATLLTVENQNLKRTVRDLEGRVTDGVLLGTPAMGRPGSNTSCPAGESAAMRALRNAVSAPGQHSNANRRGHSLCTILVPQEACYC